MVSMARPFLADAEFAIKAKQNRADEINTCIACNQACLDHVFNGQLTSCLVNPRACHELELQITPAAQRKQLAVVGAGPAGLAAAVTAVARGHQVTLFDRAAQIGGQFNLAKRIPGKEEFTETLRYYQRQLELGMAAGQLTLQLGQEVTTAQLNASDFDEVIIATGIVPRVPQLEGIDHPSVLSYIEVISGNGAGAGGGSSASGNGADRGSAGSSNVGGNGAGRGSASSSNASGNGAASGNGGCPVGRRVAIIGAGGIGFDVAEFLCHAGPPASLDVARFMAEWGVDMNLTARGGIEGVPEAVPPSPRTIYLLQRKAEGLGQGAGQNHWLDSSARFAQARGQNDSRLPVPAH